MLISIIIVNYNTRKILKQCLESIYKFEDKKIFEIIIIDNCSEDNSIEYIENLKASYKNITAVYLQSKTSFSASNNIGFELSKGDYILIMNPDIIFIEPLLEKLINDLNKNERLAVVCPLLIGTDGKFQRNYFQRYPTLLQFIFFYSILGNFSLRFPFLINRYQENGDININSNSLEFAEQIPCAFFFTKRNIFEEVGEMDESFLLFFEDVDLSYQINKKYKLAVDTSLKVKHLGGASFKSSDDYWLYGRFNMSLINFFNKNYSSTKTFCLKWLAYINSNFILLLEKIKTLFHKEDDYRVRKHKNFLNEFKKSFF